MYDLFLLELSHYKNVQKHTPKMHPLLAPNFFLFRLIGLYAVFIGFVFRYTKPDQNDKKKKRFT